MAKKIQYRDLDGNLCTGSEMDWMRTEKARAIYRDQPFIIIDERHIKEQKTRWEEGKHKQLWGAFAEAFDHLVHAGEICFVHLKEREEDDSE